MMRWDDVINSVDDSIESSIFSMFHQRKLRQRYSFNYLGEVITITVRECETLALISTGLTVPQAATQLGLSTRTVEFYVKNLRFKLKCKSKRALIVFAEQYNVLQELSISYY